VPYHGGQLAMPAGLDPENTKAVFGIMEGHRFDEAGDDLKFGCPVTSGWGRLRQNYPPGLQSGLL
jgi:hypothetical protein